MYYAGKMTEMSIKLNGLIASAIFLIFALLGFPFEHVKRKVRLLHRL